MSFRNFDNWYQDVEYDSDPSPSPPFRRSGSSLPSRTTGRRANSSSPHSTCPTAVRPAIGDDGWEVLPAELLDPSNWGLPPSSLDSIHETASAHQPTDQEPKMYPGGSSRMYPSRGDGVVQFYPDHDPDLINTNQLDGMPYVLQSSIIHSGPPEVVVNTAYNASGHRKKLSFSERWEQALLEMAHLNPVTQKNYYGIPPGRKRSFKPFTELPGQFEGRKGRLESSGGTVPNPSFGAFTNIRGVGVRHMPAGPPSRPAYTSGGLGQSLIKGGGSDSIPEYASGGAGQPLYSGQPLGGASYARENILPGIREAPRTLASDYRSAASSRAAARDAALRRDAATKVEQRRNKADLKRQEYMKEIHAHKEASADQTKMVEEEPGKESAKVKKPARDVGTRCRKGRGWGERSRDVRFLADENVACGDVGTKDQQYEYAESIREKRAREGREKEKRTLLRSVKKCEEEEDRYLTKPKRDVREKKIPPSRQASVRTAAKSALRVPFLEPTESDEEKMKPMERVKLAMARREAAIRALPAEEPSRCEESDVAEPTFSQASVGKAPVKSVTKSATAKGGAAKKAENKKKKEVAEPTLGFGNLKKK